jgi:hypothetical protein
MPNFAVIKDDVVDNIIVADTLEIAESVTGLKAVECTGLPVNIGDQYIDGQFVKPETE